MESVLIMGGSDFIGKSLAKYFIKHRHKVDVLTTGSIDYEGVNKHLLCDRKNLDELENALNGNEYTYIYDMTAFFKSEIEDLFKFVNRKNLKKYVIAGVNIGASIVEMLVIPTDNATSPCAKKLITLEDVPPGHVPTNTKPTNNASSILNNFPNTNANNGIIVNCDKHPMITFLGCLNTITKSSGFIVSPIPNITTINK